MASDQVFYSVQQEWLHGPKIVGLFASELSFSPLTSYNMMALRLKRRNKNFQRSLHMRKLRLRDKPVNGSYTKELEKHVSTDQSTC
jgi:hypothetical protein